MELKIQIKTPKGQATKAEKKIRTFILGRKKPDSVFVNEEDNEIIWVMEGSVRKMMKIQKNVHRFDKVISLLLQNKHIQNLANKKEDLDILNEMLLDHTSVEVIKEASQKELDEYGKSWLQRIKATFRSVPEEDI